MRTAAALIIGNELLSGKIADQNLLVLARELRSLGVLLRRVVMILDEVEVIAGEVRALSATHDVVFTSGGVGPTHDDLTMEGVARAFGVPLTNAGDIEALIRRYYGERVTEGHLLMARVPSGARLVSTPAVPWPTVVMRNVWILPGVPEVFQMKLPHVRAELAGDPPFASLAVYTRLDEGDLKPLLDRVVRAHTGVEIGSYPKWHGADYRTKLTFDGLDGAQVQAARDAFVAGLPEGGLVNIGGDPPAPAQG
jgi:molybdenum cofactor synthesis domain-containing protein